MLPAPSPSSSSSRPRPRPRTTSSPPAPTTASTSTSISVPGNATVNPANANSMPVRTARVTATSRSLPDTPDLAARGKGGCWTCRLRRKKCDEQRENGSCQTCIRLKIECLGWGVRRPDWMRDKVQVEAYKAGIKRQLSSQGMIRGQPRPHSLPQPPSISPLQYQYPPTRLPDTGSDGTDEYVHDQTASANTSPLYPTIQMPQLTPDLSTGVSALDLHLYPTPGVPRTPPVLPGSFVTSSPHVVDSELALMPLVPSQSYYEPPPQSLSATAAAAETREHYVLYYFRRVRPLQFLFAGSSVASIFHDLVVREPVGVVTNAICALAALHKSHVRVAEGLEDPAAENSLASLAKQYYDHAWWQLLDSRQRHCRSMEQDATAAIHLVYYWLFCGASGGDWQTPLAIACDWLADSPLNSIPNPRAQWFQLSPSARFTAQMTMWLDIFAAVSLCRAPRFMDLCRRLFRADQNYWPGSPQTPQVQHLHMDALTGCPDGIMYAFAEIATLSHWKTLQLRNHRLSIRELLRRSDAIEHDLRASWTTSSPQVFPHLIEQHPYDVGPGGSQQPQPQPTSACSSTQPSPIHHSGELVGVTSIGPMSAPEPDVGSETRRLVSNVFFEAAILYLNSVVNDHNPVVPEISDGVNATMQALNKLTLSEVDRGLVFPICLAGCLTDVPEQREFFKQRLSAGDMSSGVGVGTGRGHGGGGVGAVLGNLAQTRRLMEVVWTKRSTEGGVVDWRTTMPDIGVSLLIV